MEILYFKDLGDTAESVKFQYQRTSGIYLELYPHIKLYCNVLGIGNVMPL